MDESSVTWFLYSAMFHRYLFPFHICIAVIPFNTQYKLTTIRC